MVKNKVIIITFITITLLACFGIQDISALYYYGGGDDGFDELLGSHSLGWGGAGSRYFDGVDDYINFGDVSGIAGNNTLTVSLWVKVEGAFEGGKCLVAKQDNGSTGDQFGLITSPAAPLGAIQFHVYHAGGAYVVQSTGKMNLNAWNHVVGVYNGINVSVWINGAQEVGDAGDQDIKAGNAILSIGDYWDYNGTNAVNGTIDEVRIWNYARSQEQMESWMYKSLPDEVDGLVAYWKFDEETGGLRGSYDIDSIAITGTTSVDNSPMLRIPSN